ncbi:MAG TPA: hypothetical protein GX405_03210 [Rhizobiales bacterium]|nr:hypothetical protein [Hyphomicrobiales bacterium]
MHAVLKSLSAWLCGLLAALWLGLAAAPAAEVAFPAPGDVVPGANGITYLDLLREIVPDLEEADSVYRGRTVAPLRHIAGPDWQAEPPLDPTISGLAVLPLDGTGRILLLVDLGMAEDAAEGYAVLAIFDTVGKPRLVDAADVAFDRDTRFLDPFSLDLGAGRQAVLTESSHSNSSQTYVTAGIVLVGDRLELVDSIFTFDERTCAFERTQRLALEADPEGSGPAAIAATVVDTTKPTGADCGDDPVPAAARVTVAVTYRWDPVAERYRPDSDALEKLAADAAERF